MLQMVTWTIYCYHKFQFVFIEQFFLLTLFCNSCDNIGSLARGLNHDIINPNNKIDAKRFTIKKNCATIRPLSTYAYKNTKLEYNNQNHSQISVKISLYILNFEHISSNVI